MMVLRTTLVILALMIMVCAVSSKPQDKKTEVKVKKVLTGTTKKKTSPAEEVTESNIASTDKTGSIPDIDESKVEVAKDGDKKKNLKDVVNETRDKLGIKSKVSSAPKKIISKVITTTKPIITKKMVKVQKSVKMKTVTDTTETPSSTIITTIVTELSTEESTTTTVPSTSTTITSRKYFPTTTKYTSKQGFMGITPFSFNMGGSKGGSSFGSLQPKPKKDDIFSSLFSKGGSKSSMNDNPLGLSSLLAIGSPKKEENNKDPFGLSSLLNMGGSKPEDTKQESSGLSSLFSFGSSKPDDNNKDSLGLSSLLNFAGPNKLPSMDTKSWSSLPFLNLGGSKPGSNPASGMSSLLGSKSKFNAKQDVEDSSEE